jgi:NADH:ubiquinone oxidoreductase subunit 6 (subunit J)
LAALVYAFQQPKPATLHFGASPPVPAAERDTVAALGRTLFADHLWSVEIAGVLLLIATFGTILIALETREDRA